MFWKKKPYSSEDFVKQYLGDESLCYAMSSAFFSLPLNAQKDYDRLNCVEKDKVIRVARQRSPVTFDDFFRRYNRGCVDRIALIKSCFYEESGLVEDWVRLTDKEQERVIEYVKERVSKV